MIATILYPHKRPLGFEPSPSLYKRDMTANFTLGAGFEVTSKPGSVLSNHLSQLFVGPEGLPSTRVNFESQLCMRLHFASASRFRRLGGSLRLLQYLWKGSLLPKWPDFPRQVSLPRLVSNNRGVCRNRTGAYSMARNQATITSIPQSAPGWTRTNICLVSKTSAMSFRRRGRNTA